MKFDEAQCLRRPGTTFFSVLLTLLLLLSVGVAFDQVASPSQTVHAAARSTSLADILARNTSVMTSPPTATPSSHVPDGPLMGNGDMTAVVGGSADAQTYYISQAGFWHGQPKVIGGVTLNIPALAGSGVGYKQEQDIGNAEVRSTFTTGSSTIQVRSWTDANENTLVLSLTNASGSTTPSVTVKTFAGGQDALPTTAGLLTSGPNTMWATRVASSSTWLANAALATRILNDSSTTYSTDNSASASGTFTLNPGQTVEVATVLNGNSGNPAGSPWPAARPLSADVSAAQARVAQLNATAGNSNSVLDGDSFHNAHLQWWQNFWKSGSTIDLGGNIVERYWYTSLYALAASNRAGLPAPGMQGFQTNDTPDWGGNWTTDYNMEMPYQGLYAANHVDLTTPYDRGVSDCIAGAEVNATNNGFQGVYYPNTIAVGGQNCTGSSLKMKGNAAWLSTNFVDHWNYTRDTTWAKNVGYPYLIQVANFWDHDLQTKDASGHYNIQNSAQNESSSYQLNPIGDLAWLHYLYPALLDMSQALNVDAGRRAKWQDISANLAPYPTFTNNGHTDFKATQDAPGFYGGDANPANAAFPGNDIGLGSSAFDIQTERNTIEDLNVWNQGNSFAWIFPAAARVGLPDTYSRLVSYLSSGKLRGNSTVYQWGGGAETFGNMETVNTMLLSSYDGVMRFFSDWPATLNASFNNQLARGAFNVSSSLVGGTVQSTTISSQKGGTATLQSPWQPGSLKVIDTTNGNAVIATTTAGNLTSFPTQSGHTYQLTGTGSLPQGDLALSAIASASSSHEGDGWSVANVNDGILGTSPSSQGWSSGDANTGSNHTEWVQLDFSASTTFSTVDLYPRNDGVQTGYGFPIDFTIAVSNDGSSWTNVVSKTGYALPTGVQSFSFSSQSARYLRITGTNLRPNPHDSNQYRMQLAEIVVS